MITLSIVMDSANADAFLVQLSGTIKRRKAINDALGRRLARELQGHFQARNKEPNRMGARKTGFWKEVRESTAMTSATDDGAEVTIGEARFRIHLFGRVIKPTGGRKFLTIPLIKEARGMRVREYEKQTGRKLFRLPGSRVLVERSSQGNRSLASSSTGTIRTRSGFRKIGIGAQTQLRTVYALSPQAVIKRDPKALPDTRKLVEALLETGNAWLDRNINSKST